MPDGHLSGSPFAITSEAFNRANDPRNSIDSGKIVNGAIVAEKIADNAVTMEKLSEDVKEKINGELFDNSLDFVKMKITPGLLNFNASVDIFNVLDYEGFNPAPSVWQAADGTMYAPTLSIEEQPNILGLKYSRCFTVSDIKKADGTYYISPYASFVTDVLKDENYKSFCFYINLKYLKGNQRGLFMGLESSGVISLQIKWGTDTHREGSLSANGTIIHLSVDIYYTDYRDEDWAFVRGMFWADNFLSVKNHKTVFRIGFVGGEGHVGEKTVTCGWTFVAGKVELLPFQYYPYDKSFFELFSEQNIPDGSISENMIADNAITQKKIADDVSLSTTALTNGLYGQAGDSISEGAGLTSFLDSSDPYAPISGTKKATYGYYIAKLNRMRWANYGLSGSTLGDVIYNGIDKRGFSKENGRYTQMDDDLTHLSIFFGWNDSAYGPIMKREEWLLDTYDTKIYYPRSSDLIGTIADDGTPYATQEQYAAVNAVKGNVGGIDYDNSNTYFSALYIGTKDDATNKTFWGAWNVVLPYLIEKYPLAKILLIVPFGTNALTRQCVRDAAKKYGLAVYDFSSTDNQLFFQWDDNIPDGRIAEQTISEFRRDALTSDGLHPNEKGYKYLYPSINAKLMSL